MKRPDFESTWSESQGRARPASRPEGSAPRSRALMRAVTWIAFGVVVTIGLASSAACSGTNDQLRQRATFDLDCPPEQIRIVDLGGGTRGVTGCDRRATYVHHCERHGFGGTCESGNWIMNTSGGENAPR